MKTVTNLRRYGSGMRAAGPSACMTRQFLPQVEKKASSHRREFGSGESEIFIAKPRAAREAQPEREERAERRGGEAA